MSDTLLVPTDGASSTDAVIEHASDDPTRNLLDSTSQKVVTLSPVPVLTVRIEEPTDAEPPVDAARTPTD